MRSLGEMIGCIAPRRKGKLTKKAKMILLNWAMEAHKLDSSRPLGYYYHLFLDGLRRQYSKSGKEQFFKAGIIE